MARSHHINRLLHDQRGGTAIWFALCLPVLLGFAALAVDLARLNLIKVELQNAADAAALAGARLLTDPSGEKPYSWSVAEGMAKSVAKQNHANGALIQDANVSVDSGFWNIPGSSYNPSHTSTATGDVPAVHARVSLSGLKLYFAPILGISDSDVHADAIAVIAPPGGGTGMFPMAINSFMFNLFWDSTTNKPKLDPKTGRPYVIDISSVYSCNKTSGQWTSFADDANNVPAIRELLANGNPTNLKIGDNIWIQPGTKATLYSDVPTNIDVAIPVVNNVDTHSFQPIVAIAGFHIDSSTKHGNKSYIEGHFIDATIISSLNPGNSNGLPLGAYTPPLLVE